MQLTQKAAESLSVLFDEGEDICYGDKCARSITPFDLEQMHKPYTHTSKEGVGYRSHPVTLISLNPFKPGSTRADDNVVKHRNFLFEIDGADGKTVPIEVQKLIFKAAEVPGSVGTFSGSKSIHTIVSLEVPLEDSVDLLDPSSNFFTTNKQSTGDLYRYIWCRIASHITDTYRTVKGNLKQKYIVDASVKNPSRFTRFPGAIRPNTGLVQETTCGRRIPFDVFKTFINQIPDIPMFQVNPVKNTTAPKLVVGSLYDFLSKAPVTVVKKFKEIKECDDDTYFKMRDFYIALRKRNKMTCLEMLDFHRKITEPVLIEKNYDLVKLNEEKMFQWIEDNIE